MQDLPKLPVGEEVRPALIRNGQQWSGQKQACYKCADFQSNMPMTGRCGALEKSPVIVSGDMCKGDTCSKFNLRPDAWQKTAPKMKGA